MDVLVEIIRPLDEISMTFTLCTLHRVFILKIVSN